MEEHVCKICSRTFKTPNALLAHSRAHKKDVAEEKQSQWVAPEPGPIPRFDTVPENEILPKHGKMIEPEPGPIPFGGLWAPGAEISAQKIAQNTGAAPALTNVQTLTVTTPVIPVVRLKKHPHALRLPVRATPGSAGLDVHAAIDKPICIGAGERTLVPTGLSIELPLWFVAKMVPRSGLAISNGITLLNSPGIIDSDYRGEIKLIVVNHSRTKFWVQPGMRLAQMMIEQQPIVSIELVDELSDSSRGGNGFGSTGTN